MTMMESTNGVDGRRFTAIFSFQFETNKLQKGFTKHAGENCKLTEAHKNKNKKTFSKPQQQQKKSTTLEIQ